MEDMFRMLELALNAVNPAILICSFFAQDDERGS